MALSANQRSALENLSSGELSDAMENLDFLRSVIVSLHAVGGHQDRLIGPALTIAQIAKHASDSKEAGLVKHGSVALDQVKPGEIIVLDAKGRTDVGSWGEIHTLNARTSGAAGILVNGAIRDPGSVRETGLPVYCRGYSPIKSRWDLATASINMPIEIDGVQIRPGDIVFADEGGTIVMPEAGLDSIIAEAERVQRDDTAIKERFAARGPAGL